MRFAADFDDIRRGLDICAIEAEAALSQLAGDQPEGDWLIARRRVLDAYATASLDLARVRQQLEDESEART